MTLLGGQGGYFQKSSRDSETSDTTSEGLGETFEGRKEISWVFERGWERWEEIDFLVEFN